MLDDEFLSLALVASNPAWASHYLPVESAGSRFRVQAYSIRSRISVSANPQCRAPCCPVAAGYAVSLEWQQIGCGPSMAPPRLAGVVTVVGSSCAIVGTFLPWIEATDPSSGITLTKAGIEGHYAILVDLLAVIAAGIGGFVLFRRPASAAVVLTLMMLALAQLSLVIFVWSNLSRGVVQLQAVGALASIGLGLYFTGLGTVVALVGCILAWKQRPSRVS